MNRHNKLNNLSFRGKKLKYKILKNKFFIAYNRALLSDVEPPITFANIPKDHTTLFGGGDTLRFKKYL